MGDVSVRVVSIDDLIQLKRLAGRPQDREDVAKLEEVRRLKGQDGER